MWLCRVTMGLVLSLVILTAGWGLNSPARAVDITCVRVKDCDIKCRSLDIVVMADQTDFDNAAKFSYFKFKDGCIAMWCTKKEKLNNIPKNPKQVDCDTGSGEWTCKQGGTKLGFMLFPGEGKSFMGDGTGKFTSHENCDAKP
jgi:hypothetical protein